mmetsp:Transcript_20814/g.65891  ORF Transcript_20814/g.65891 Transcript_20814/m.65891 type:complete len:308 (+) Transcript_20814:115-1038(+)
MGAEKLSPSKKTGSRGMSSRCARRIMSGSRFSCSTGSFLGNQRWMVTRQLIQMAGSSTSGSTCTMLSTSSASRSTLFTRATFLSSSSRGCRNVLGRATNTWVASSRGKWCLSVMTRWNTSSTPAAMSAQSPSPIPSPKTGSNSMKMLLSCLSPLTSASSSCPRLFPADMISSMTRSLWRARKSNSGGPTSAAASSAAPPGASGAAPPPTASDPPAFLPSVSPTLSSAPSPTRAAVPRRPNKRGGTCRRPPLRPQAAPSSTGRARLAADDREAIPPRKEGPEGTRAAAILITFSHVTGLQVTLKADRV